MNATLPPRPAALLLDAGNTLVFLDEHAVAEAAGGAVRPERVRQALGPAIRRYEASLDRGASHEEGWDVYMRVLLAEAGADATSLEETLARVRTAHDAHNLWRRVPEGMPGALDALLDAGVRLAVVSNSEGSIATLLAQVGLAARFETIVDSAVVGFRKPDRRIFEHALQQLGVGATDAVYVGDVPRVDVIGARAAGLGAILIDAFGLYPAYAEAPRITHLGELARAWGRVSDS